MTALLPSDNSLRAQESEQHAKKLAAAATSPTYNGAVVAQAFGIYRELDFFALQDALAEQCKSVHGGDMGRAETMLTAQAHALDAIFASLALRAKAQDRLPHLEAYLKLALRAQSQCRATLETLAAIKNPPVVFAKQANITTGPQQVNNGVACEPSRTEENGGEKPIEQHKLLSGNDHGERLDHRTAGTAGQSDPIMATVGTLDGAANGAGKGRGEP